MAGRRGAGRGDRAAAGGEPVHRAAAAGQGARAGPAAAGGPGTGRRGRAGGGTGRTVPGPAGPVPPEPEAPADDGPAGPVSVRSRYAGAMLLHAFAARAGAAEIWPAAAGGQPRRGDGRCWRPSARASRWERRRPSSSSTWRRPRPGRWPGWRPAAGPADPAPGAGRHRRPRRPAGAAADVRRRDAGRGPGGLRACTTSMTTSSPTPAPRPVGKGWNNKRGRAEKGRADTHVTAHDGRAVCFVTGEPSGLSVTLPKALAELKKAVPAGTTDHARLRPRRRLPASLHALPRAAGALGDLPAGAAGRPGHAPGHHHGHRRRQDPRAVAWAEEKVQLKDYGEARQLTLFEHGKVVLQILTSDFEACPADILDWLKSRWREENFLKYASENYGIDKICDYAAEITVNTKVTANPARKTANARRPRRGKGAGRRRACPRRAARRPGHHPGRQEQGDPRRQPRDQRGEEESQGRHRRPGQRSRQNCPPTRSTPAPAPPCCAPGAAACRWCCGCSPTTPSTGSPAAQRLPARRRRIPRHHPRDHHPRPRRNHHLHPRRDQRRPRTPRPNPASPAPSPCSSTRSTHSPPPSPATTGRSPTASHRSQAFNPDRSRLPEIWGIVLSAGRQTWVRSRARGGRRGHKCDTSHIGSDLHRSATSPFALSGTREPIICSLGAGTANAELYRAG